MVSRTATFAVLALAILGSCTALDCRAHRECDVLQYCSSNLSCQECSLCTDYRTFNGKDACKRKRCAAPKTPATTLPPITTAPPTTTAPATTTAPTTTGSPSTSTGCALHKSCVLGEFCSEMRECQSCKTCVDTKTYNGKDSCKQKRCTSFSPTTTTTTAAPMGNLNMQIASMPELSAFSTAVAAVNFGSILSGLGPFTVFAPNEDAFRKLDNVKLGMLRTDSQYVAAVLTTHVVAGALDSRDLVDGQTLTTVSGAKLYVTVVDGRVFIASTPGTLHDAVNSAELVALNILAKNGITHIIDALLLPPPTPFTTEATTTTTITTTTAASTTTTITTTATTTTTTSGIPCDNHKSCEVGSFCASMGQCRSCFACEGMKTFNRKMACQQRRCAKFTTILTTTTTTTTTTTVHPDVMDRDDVAIETFGSLEATCAVVAADPQGYCETSFISYICPVVCGNGIVKPDYYNFDQDALLLPAFGMTCEQTCVDTCKELGLLLLCPETCATSRPECPTTTAPPSTTEYAEPCTKHRDCDVGEFCSEDLQCKSCGGCDGLTTFSGKDACQARKCLLWNPPATTPATLSTSAASTRTTAPTTVTTPPAVMYEICNNVYNSPSSCAEIAVSSSCSTIDGRSSMPFTCARVRVACLAGDSDSGIVGARDTTCRIVGAFSTTTTTTTTVPTTTTMPTSAPSPTSASESGLCGCICPKDTCDAVFSCSLTQSLTELAGCHTTLGAIPVIPN